MLPLAARAAHVALDCTASAALPLYVVAAVRGLRSQPGGRLDGSGTN